MTTHEISFKIQSDVDINSWLLKYNNKVPEMLKIKMEREHPGLFEEVKKYFIFYYKNDNLWIKNFDFLRKMRPDIKNKIISHTFFPLLSTFSYFFSDLEANFKYKIALNLKSKIIEKQEMIISEKNSNPKNKIKYIYFIGKGLVSIRKDDKEICLYESGGYFGDEYFLSETAQFTYKNASDSDMFLFCCPIEIIKEMCVNYEESFLILLIKTLICFSRIRHEAEIFGLKFEDKNKEFFSKIHQNINKKIETKKVIFKKNDFQNTEFIKENKLYPNSLEDINPRNQIIEMDEIKLNDIEENMSPIKLIHMKTPSDEFNENIPFEIKTPIDEIKENNKNNKVYTEDSSVEDIFDNLNFLDKIEFNEENIGNIIKLKFIVQNLNDSKQILDNLFKKVCFLANQVTFLKKNYESMIVKSKNLIDLFELKMNYFD